MSIIDFHRQVAIRSASPHPDREPEKRNQPPAPVVERKAEPRDPRPRTAEEIETWRRAQQLGIDVQGVFNTKAFIGRSADGRTPPGAMPWHWCYGRQPVRVKGAVYADSDEGRHLVKDISEAQAQRTKVTWAMGKLTARQIANALRIPLDAARRLVTERNKAASDAE